MRAKENMKLSWIGWLFLVVLFCLLPVGALAQTGPDGHEEVPLALRPKAPTPDPETPKARPFYDARYGVSFTVPMAWNLNRKDAEVSTFRLDVMNAAHTAALRAVASISFNPHPSSTFSGALFYYSVVPRTSAALCTAQAIARAPRTITTEQVNGITFTHGYDEHGTICTESRDEIYTTERNGICYRFDAVINNFCGGEVSGVRDISEDELDSVRSRMQRILETVQFDPK